MLKAASDYKEGSLGRLLFGDDRPPKAPGEGMLVAIAPDVEALPMLETGVLEGAKVLVLDPEGDSIAQITEAIGESQISSLHLVGHGAPGSLSLGGTVLSLANIQQYRQPLLEWGVSEILIYGCNVAAEPEFLQVLHQLTGANIAASAKKVGNAAKGGSWELETLIGKVETRLTFEPEVIRNYPGVFGPFGTDVYDETKLPVLDFSQANYRVNENGQVVGAEITIDRTVKFGRRSTVEVKLGDGSAKGGEDFDDETIEVEFGPGERSKTITIPIRNDKIVEGDEDLTLTLENVSENSLIGPRGTATLKILDNDVPRNDAGGDSIADASKIRVGADKTYSDWVGREDGDDYYKFTLGAGNRVNLSLDGMTANANLELLDSEGEVVASSKNSGNAAESISKNLDGGLYNLRVSSVGNNSTLYDLNIETKPLLNGISTGGTQASFFTTGPASTGGAFSPSDAQAGSLIGMDLFRADARFADIDGRGFATVILDTGIDADHPFFGDRVVHTFDFTGNGDVSDPTGHGSNISSIVASSDGTHTGMAPGANIIHLKVFEATRDPATGNVSTSADAADIEQALQWVVDNADVHNIASVNMSLSDGVNYTAPTQKYDLDDELAALANKNIIVSSSSGNKFGSHNSKPGVSYPSADPNSLSIGAVYDANVGGKAYEGDVLANSTDADRVTPFSQRHQDLTTVFAPGAVITGADHNGGTTSLQGTSQAAAHISGIAVLTQQLAERELGRRLTPQEFGQLVRDTGVTVNDGDDEDDNVTNTGLDYQRVNMMALAEEIFVNHAPVVTSPPLFRQGANWTGNPALRNSLQFTFAENTFTDPDPGDTLTYKAEWLPGVRDWSWPTINGVRRPIPRQWDAIRPLPDTIEFNPATRTFTVDPRMTGDNWIKVTATDKSGASVSDHFHIFRRHDGIGIDNYIEGGTAFFDANKNGVLDAGEPSDTTNEKGEFSLNIDPLIFDTDQNGTVDPEEGRLVVMGGTDTATGLPLETPISATPDSTVVTMLTSVAADLVEQGLTVQQAQNRVKNAFSLPSAVDLATLDPVAATEADEPGAAEVFNSTIQVQNTVTQIAHLLDGASTADLDELSGAAVTAIANKVKDGKLNLEAPKPIEGLIKDAANAAKAIDPEIKVNLISDVAGEAAKVVAQSNDRIGQAASSNTGADISKEVAKVQVITMGETSDDLLEVTAGTKDIEQVVAENTGSMLNEQIKSGVGEDLESNPGEEIKGTRSRDVLTGGDGDDTIIGHQGRDILTGGEGSDRFVYDSLLDAGDRIKDFEPGSDRIILTELLDGLGYEGNNAIADDYIKFASRGGTTMISIDSDGPDGPGRFRTFIAVEDVSKNALNDPSNFGF
jgi:subtilisin family serine protease